MRGKAAVELAVLGIAAVASALVAASPAWADSASITDFKKVNSEKYSATFTVTSDGCRPDGVCGWFAYAVQGPGDQPCTDSVEGDGRGSWLGQRRDGAGTFTESATFLPIHESLVMCVYINRGEGSIPTLIGELRQTVEIELGKAEAIKRVPSIIRLRTRAKPTHLKTTDCKRLSKTRFECIVAWINRKKLWSGLMTIRETGSEYQHKFDGSTWKLSCLKRHPGKRLFAGCRRKVRW